MSPAAYGVKPVLEGKVNSLPFAILPSVLSFLLCFSIVFERVDALPTQETQVQSLVWDISTCSRATEPTHHSYRALTLEPGSHSNKDPGQAKIN